MASGSQKSQPNRFQPPKGTRDFYPQDMAVRRYIERVWRQVSINHGFDEVEGPMFEHLDLYTHKSGPGIVSEIFQVFSGKDEAEAAQIRSGKSAPYALRPEFTPTLARMVAAEAASLPRPIKWFAIPQHFRAESPQRGRLREFMQWNVDFIGEESPKADAEVIGVLIRALQALGLGPEDVRVRYSDRGVITSIFGAMGIDSSKHDLAFQILDRALKLTVEAFREQVRGAELPVALMEVLRADTHGAENVDEDFYHVAEAVGGMTGPLFRLRESFGELSAWMQPDLTIARGLAYYTGLVFEVHEATGAERAIAGGGRYDKLIESFGGPSLPACGFGMGDVVLGNILRDKGLLKDEIIYEPIRPDAFVISNGDEIAETQLPRLVASLRRDGLHVRHTYKSTRNVGKLLGEAGKTRARFAVILGRELADNPPQVVVKNLDSQQQELVALEDLPKLLKSSQQAH